MKRREPKPFWNREWLASAYLVQGLSAKEIADQFGCTENNVLMFLHKHKIATRSIAEARKMKRWGSHGVDNPMWNRKGELNPNWKDGVTEERQAFYSSKAWKSACSAVWKRDKAACRRCGLPKKCGDMPFHIHHLRGFAEVSTRADKEALVLLCEACHQWVHSNGNVNGDFIQNG